MTFLKDYRGTSTMTSVNLLRSSMQDSFVYEDLVSHIRTIEERMMEIETTLAHQWKTNQNQIKSRSIAFVDHLGNLTSEKYMDHQQIEKITMNYKKNYVPKYLHEWTKFGMMKDNSILPLTNLQLKSTVSNFENGQEFFTCGEITVWIGTFEDSSSRKIVVPVFLLDNMEKVKIEIKKQRQFNDIELKLFVIDENEKPTEKNWTEGTPLILDDTFFSSQLFQKNHVIIAKVTNPIDSSIVNFQLSINHGTRKISCSVNSGMDIATLRELVENQEGIPSHEQGLFSSDIRLEDGRTLEDYGITNDITLTLVYHLRGGMYHFTSGRQDFSSLSDTTAQAVKNVLALNFRDIGHSPSQLQDSLLQAKACLLTLFGETASVHLKTIILSISTDN